MSYSDSHGRIPCTHLVLRVINHGWVPNALVVGVWNGGGLPLTTAWAILTLWVGDSGWLPLTILLLIPVLWLLSLCIFSRIGSVQITMLIATTCSHCLRQHMLVAWGGTCWWQSAISHAHVALLRLYIVKHCIDDVTDTPSVTVISLHTSLEDAFTKGTGACLGHQSPQARRLATLQASQLPHQQSLLVHPRPSHLACWPLGLQSFSESNTGKSASNYVKSGCADFTSSNGCACKLSTVWPGQPAQHRQQTALQKAPTKLLHVAVTAAAACCYHYETCLVVTYLAVSTQSSGFDSSGSSISCGGLNAGVKSSNKLPAFFSSPSIRIV